MSARQNLPFDAFLMGMAQLERYYRRKLHENDRTVYYDGVKEVGPHKWEKCIQYAMHKSKTLPKLSELREWMGLGEPLPPREEEDGFRPGTIGGKTPAEIIEMEKLHQDLPFPSRFANPVEEMCYLMAVEKGPKPPDEATTEERLAYVRAYAEAGAALYEQTQAAKGAGQ